MANSMLTSWCLQVDYVEPGGFRGNADSRRRRTCPEEEKQSTERKRLDKDLNHFLWLPLPVSRLGCQGNGCLAGKRQRSWTALIKHTHTHTHTHTQYVSVCPILLSPDVLYWPVQSVCGCSSLIQNNSGLLLLIGDNFSSTHGVKFFCSTLSVMLWSRGSFWLHLHPSRLRSPPVSRHFFSH